VQQVCKADGLPAHDLVVRQELAIPYLHALVESNCSVGGPFLRSGCNSLKDRHKAGDHDCRLSRLSCGQGRREALWAKADPSDAHQIRARCQITRNE
jgi:hypothetical protein